VIDATGSGSLLIAADESVSLGSPLSPTPAREAVNIAFPSPPPGSDLIGAPRVTLTYRGTAVPARTFLYAQLVDASSGRVVGGQVTPIPVVLDGRTRSIERSLEVIAAHSVVGSSYKLQLTPGTPVYAPQRSVGLVDLRQITATLPLVDATRSAAAPATIAARHQPRRPRIAVSSLREGQIALVRLRSQLRSRPCGGVVSFAVRVRGRVYPRDADVTARCRAQAILRLSVAPGARARVSARFLGNDVLEPRRARSVLRRLR
jgi:hypothetical protein